MTIYQDLQQVVIESGLWNGVRRKTHDFLLSPDVFKLTVREAEELKELGMAIYDCLAGIGRVATIASNPKLAFNNTWRRLGSAFSAGIPAFYSEIQFLHPGGVPVICKVDLMRGVEGRFYIAEIDGHNKHGLGYSILARSLSEVVSDQGVSKFPGVAVEISRVLSQNGKQTHRLMAIVAKRERFYVPEIHILTHELAKFGTQSIVVHELDGFYRKLVSVGNLPEDFGWATDLPFMFDNSSLVDALVSLYKGGKLEFLIPPRPFFGSKVVLALLRNENEDPELEAILRAFIPIESLRLVRAYLPETYLVSNEATASYWREKAKSGFVLKEAISSGMKGTKFNDEEDFKNILEQACNSRNRFVLQREVQNQAFSFRYYNELGELREESWFTRITVHYVRRGVADIVVTARRDKKVHGAPDCLQLGTVII